jgi:hypothetical protein
VVISERAMSSAPAEMQALHTRPVHPMLISVV